MCTYQTEILRIEASAKGPGGWCPVSAATVYFDHPNHFQAVHSLNIDLLSPGDPSAPRVAAMELDPASARELAHAILRALEAARHEGAPQGEANPGR